MGLLQSQVIVLFQRLCFPKSLQRYKNYLIFANFSRINCAFFTECRQTASLPSKFSALFTSAFRVTDALSCLNPELKKLVVDLIYTELVGDQSFVK